MPLKKTTATRWRELPEEHRAGVLEALAKKVEEKEQHSTSTLVPASYAPRLLEEADAARRARAVLLELGDDAPSPPARRSAFTTTLRDDVRAQLQAEARRRGLRINQLIEELVIERPRR